MTSQIARPLLLVALTLLGGAETLSTPPAFRLPAGVRPTHYGLDLKIVPAEPTFSGSVTIDLQVDAPTSLVWLNASALSLSGGELRAGGKAQAATVVPGGTDYVGLRVPHPIGKGPAQLFVRFSGKLDTERSRGLYRVSEGPGDDDAYAYTFFEPIDARRAFPCFDEPSFKVPWQLTLHVKQHHVALANAKVAAERSEPGGMKSVIMEVSKPLPSYLVALVVGPFDLIDGGRAGRGQTPIRFIVPRGRGGETGYARAVTPRIIEQLEKFFAIPYPYEKLDVAVVPRYWGTMEHPGIVAIGQPLALIKPEEEGLHRQQAYANTAIHELAHYWFGDYVTCRFWNDVWLNESLGSWADGKLTDALEPGWKYTLGRDVVQIQQAMAADGEPTVQAIRLPVKTNDDIQNSFDGQITYVKGMAVLHMVEHWVGEAKFLDAIRKYLETYAWGNADADDFLAVLRTELGPPAAAVMQSFITQPGVPIVSAALRCEGNSARVTLTQKRFFAAGDSPSAQSWQLPVCMKWDGGRACALLDAPSKEMTLPACPRWLLLNEDGAGYYHSRLDAPTLAVLRPQFATALTPRERAQLAADVAAESAQGTLGLGAALDLLPSLLADPDLRVYQHGVNLLWALHPRELGGEQLAAFGRAVAKLLGPRARTVGWAPGKDEDPEMTNVRPMLLAMMARFAHDPAVQAQARSRAADWLTDHKKVAPDMVTTALHLSAQNGGAQYFDKLLTAARTTTDRRERTLLLSALGSFVEPTLHQRALTLIVGQEFDLRDSIGIVYRALFTPGRETREAAWIFLQRHFDTISARMRDDESLPLFRSLPESFCDAAHRRQIETFLTPRAKQHAGAAQALADGLAAARTCEAALARNRDAITAFLSRF